MERVNEAYLGQQERFKLGGVNKKTIFKVCSMGLITMVFLGAVTFKFFKTMNEKSEQQNPLQGFVIR